MSNDSQRTVSTTDDHTIRAHPGTHPNFYHSLGNAWRGARHVFRHERNARIHAVFAVSAIVVALLLRVPGAALAAVLLAVTLVVVAEILNTAMERTLDLIDTNENAHIKVIKDMAAGGVLVAAVMAVAVGLVVYGPPLVRMLWGN